VRSFNVDVTWFDGALSDAKQRAAIDGAPVEKVIKAGVPVIDMDTLIAPLDQIDVHSFLAPDNEFMGAAVAQVLMDQIGAKDSW